MRRVESGNREITERRRGGDRRKQTRNGRRQSDPQETHSDEQSLLMQLRRPESPDDIVIQRNGAGGYVIVKADGERIGMASDRLEAMRRGCVAARATGASVWVRVDRAKETYHEVLCP
jgi:hypothetical protein